MTSFQATYLWLTTLAESRDESDSHSEQARERLRSTFLRFRERAKVLAGEIALDLPDFTVHDVEHLDALWEMADLIAGPDYPLTPTEAFVLGGAFLIHDLGMSLATYPRGMNDLREEESWNATLISAFRQVYGRFPNAEELEAPPHAVEDATVANMLRNLHPRRAEELVSNSWDSDGETYYLIEDADLRRDLGPAIGQIAHSHWWSVEQVREKFTDLSRRTTVPTI